VDARLLLGAFVYMPFAVKSAKCKMAWQGYVAVSLRISLSKPKKTAF
jgi:hypothetical protein